MLWLPTQWMQQGVVVQVRMQLWLQLWLQLMQPNRTQLRQLREQLRLLRV
jgi:hypothetical protein